MDREYLVSVVTPFHNTRLDLFAKCLQSLKDQSIGFENIEWVVTLHNCEAEYVQAARDMVEGLPNVKMDELYNDFRTASSPRNECMRHVTGKYVFFLDADDFLFPEALEKLRAAMEEHGADIGTCREESIVASEGLQMIEHLRFKFMLDQTRPLIVLHRDSPEMSKYLITRNGTVHKMYRVGLIREHGLNFPDDIVIGEDITFNLRCAKHAQTIVVLPQYIGYGYMMNAGSLAQSMGGTSLEDMVSTLRDRYAWLEAAADSGLDAPEIAWIALGSAAKILSAPGLPEDVVAEWHPKFAAYIGSFAPMDLRSKFLSEQQVQGLMDFARSYFSGADAAEVNDNRKLLDYILAENSATEIGQNCRFDRIRSYEVFKKSVPLSDYSFYAPLVDLTTRIGETNIFCAQPPVGYSLTSGTTGEAKLVPYTARHLDTYIAAMRDVLGAGEPTFALMESLPKGMTYVDGATSDSIIGATLAALRLEIVECSYAKRFKQGSLTSPIELLFPEEVIDPRYARLLFALLDRDVTQIVAPFTWTLLDAMQFLEKHHAQLADDIEHGEITYTNELPEALRATLQAKLKADPERAEELRKAAAEGFEGIIGRLWPKCRRIVAAGTGTFSLYTRKLAFYAGQIAFNNGYVAASEAVVGRAMGEGTAEYALLTDNAFFEFLEPGSSEPVAVDGLEPGRRYELILTNSAGLYRYRLGDVVQIERIEKGVPVFSYAYRMEESLHLGEATITEDELEEVAVAIEAGAGADVRDFCAMAEDGRLVVFVEPASTLGELEKLLAFAPASRSAAVDAILKGLDADYARAREAGMAGAPEVRILEPETHLLYRDRTMLTERIAPDQIKPVRALNTQAKRKFFNALAIPE